MTTKREQKISMRIDTSPVRLNGVIEEINLVTGDFKVSFDGPVETAWFRPYIAYLDGTHVFRRRPNGVYPQSGDCTAGELWTVIG